VRWIAGLEAAKTWELRVGCECSKTGRLDTGEGSCVKGDRFRWRLSRGVKSAGLKAARMVGDKRRDGEAATRVDRWWDQGAVRSGIGGEMSGVASGAVGELVVVSLKTGWSAAAGSGGWAGRSLRRVSSVRAIWRFLSNLRPLKGGPYHLFECKIRPKILV
jgi:hypothetical protein